MDFECDAGAGGVRHGLRHLLRRVSVPGGRLAAGVAGGLRGAGAAAAGATGVSLDGRYARVRHPAATDRERPMTASVIADSIVNLCGALGLCVAMFALHRRDPKSPLTQRL